MNSTVLSLPALAAGMRAACDEARRWMGATAPNPPVGAAALDSEGKILAVAAHRKAGTDHAEAALLKICRLQSLLPHVHTLCVTLEPCNHHGRTPPCSGAIIESGIRHVAVGTCDPNPNVAGGGVERLKASGITVTDGVENDLCRSLIYVFTFESLTGRPFVTVKRAFDANCSMIPPAGQKTFTSSESLSVAHRLRKKADAIVTGSGTILADNPRFTVRRVADFEDKKRVLAILDRRKRVPRAYLDEVRQRGVEPILYDNLDSCILDLEKRRMMDILVESGPILSQSVLDSPLWNLQIDIFQGIPDRIEVKLHPDTQSVLKLQQLSLEAMLPL